MQSAKDRFGNDSASLGKFDAPRYGGVVIQRLVRSRSVVVVEVLCEYPKKVRVAENDDVIETIPTNRADDAFSERVLPRRPW